MSPSDTHASSTTVSVSPRRFYAHSDPAGLLPDEPGARWEPLYKHLREVAETARTLGRRTAPGDEVFARATYWAGLLHDFGKYSDAFQRRIRGASERAPHADFGASISEGAGAREIALAIAGHHAGLPAPESDDHTNLAARVERRAEEAAALLPRFFADFPDLGADQAFAGDRPQGAAASREGESLRDLRVRMLFSCLVDADRLCTARFLGDPVPDPSIPPPLDPAARLERLLCYVESLAAALPDGVVKRARREVLDACLAAAGDPRRLFSLTVPTGGAKTLASMAFALRRAALRPAEVDRIIVVIPYLSIIEQNAGVYANALGPDAIFEHHSGDLRRRDAPGGRGDDRVDAKEEPLPATALHRKVAAENWDVPIVVTTSVRFFESLFSNHPSDLRRLRSIARSVVIFDEVQTVPPHFLRAILSVLKGLSQAWSTTILLCTATQPAFERRESAADDGSDLWPSGTLREIIENPQSLFGKLKRVEVEVRGRQLDGAIEPTSFATLAGVMAVESRALAIVNVRAHASELYAAIRAVTGAAGCDEGLFHLSTLMCPKHRLLVLEQLRVRLARPGERCLLVATQLVEAGVDLDFPVVFRALAPFDAIAQAAGRCDREGRLTAAHGSPAGRVVVFATEDGRTPPGAYRTATDVTAALMRDGPPQIDSPGQIRRYFRAVYNNLDLDSRDIEPLRRKLDFPSVSERFAMIDDCTQGVLVPFDDEARSILRAIDARGFALAAERSALQRLSIGLFPNDFRDAVATGAVRELAEPGSGLWAAQEGSYDQAIGFVGGGGGGVLIA